MDINLKTIKQNDDIKKKPRSNNRLLLSLALSRDMKILDNDKSYFQKKKRNHNILENGEKTSHSFNQRYCQKFDNNFDSNYAKKNHKQQLYPKNFIREKGQNHSQLKNINS